VFYYHTASATDYYISADGNDSNTGTSETAAWQTLTKLSAELGGPSGTWGNISSGDHIYFRRGDTFRGFIAFSAFNNNGITFDAYGTGAKPIIKGSSMVSGWAVHSGNIWKATVNSKVYFLYVDGVLQILARTPNTGFWNLTAATTNSITSTDIGNSGIDFVGSNVCITEYNWRLNRQVVTTQSSNTVSWASSIEGTSENGANFYFDNKLALLDVAGEWFYDDATNTLYYMTDGTDPNTLSIEASVNLIGLVGNDNRSNNIIRNLDFQHYADKAIRLMGASNNNLIENCKFNHNFQGLFLSGDMNTIQIDTILNAYLQGAVLANMENSEFKQNIITNAGLIYGLHRPNFSGDFYSGGIWLINGKTGATIRNNLIENVGNMGIRFGGSGVIIEKNEVKNTMLNMDDGGAIYTFGGNNTSYNNTVRNNIVNNVVGVHHGSQPGTIVLGIYIDNYSYNITIENNTVENVQNGGGILINAGAYNCTITGNITYKCKQGLAFADWLPGQSIYDNTVTNNTFYANLLGSIPIQIGSYDNNHNTISASDNNFLCNPYGSSVVEYIWSNEQFFTLAQWRTATGFDLASVGSYYMLPYPIDNSFLVINNTSSAQNYNFSNTVDLNNQIVTLLTLTPFNSKVLINTTILPVELVRFEGRNENSINILTWETSSEHNNAYFEVERSRDAIKFLPIGKVEGKGNTVETTNYYFEDDKFIYPTNYYRLRQVDKDGSANFSKVIVIHTQKTNMMLTPNPTKDFLCIKTENKNQPIVVINTLGEVVYKANKIPDSLDFSNFLSGIYFVQISGQIVKVVKQ
jgi:parallel beta-helix repeat protein